ncbi:MAG: ABC transporter ATP-binding protein [Candidatus Omnitrophica bacterium]|nr:ABC transporter ATP-binding protein [Candidatus Omnitrophota bacterium]
MTLIAKDIHKSYRSGPKEVRAVDGVSLQIERAESIAIVGPSGAGKSTLLHIMGGLDKPTSGKIILDDVDIYRLSDRKRSGVRNGKIGFVFQFYHLLPEFTAIENVMLPGMMKGPGSRGKGQGTRDRAREILRAVGLENRINHRPGELSGGESQRVAIARALVNEPEILLCDEPTGNLDSKTSASIYDLLFNLKSGRKMSLVIVTHDEKISSMVQETVRLKDGKII